MVPQLGAGGCTPRPRTLRAGQRITVTLNPLRNGRPGGVVRDVTDAEGKPVGTNR